MTPAVPGSAEPCVLWDDSCCAWISSVCCGMTPAVPGSAEPCYVAEYMSSGSNDHLLLGFTGEKGNRRYIVCLQDPTGLVKKLTSKKCRLICPHMIFKKRLLSTG